jgi:hypothetical protein
MQLPHHTSWRNEPEITDAINNHQQGEKFTPINYGAGGLTPGNRIGLSRNQLILSDIPYIPRPTATVTLSANPMCVPRVIMGEDSQIVDSGARSRDHGNNVLFATATSAIRRLATTWCWKHEIEASIVMKNC